MSQQPTDPDERREQLAGYAVLAIAVAIAIIGARDYAGGWNDGSRLATVESLVDQRTWAIDHSVFVEVPSDRLLSDKPFPYPRDDPSSIYGTQDKILVRGHYYSHKSPLPALVIAGGYAVWQKITGDTAHDRCDEFCYWMTLVSSGSAFVVAVMAIFALGGALGLRLSDRMAITSSFGLATVLPAYSRNVNDHILLLAVVAVLTVNLVRLAQAVADDASRRPIWPRLAILGTLAGLAYTIDLAAGPLLLMTALACVIYRLGRNWAGLAIFLVAALPWVALHQSLNYTIGGTLTPLGSVAEYFDWPGSPFRRETLTGFWNHASLLGFAYYLAALLVDPQRGFLLHNLPLLVLVPGTVRLARRRTSEWFELLALTGWAAGVWLIYGALSVNFSGDCCSIRWFVPLLAPGYLALAILLRDDVRYRRGHWLLSLVGLPLAAMMWWQGPWDEPHTPYFIPLELTGLAVWFGWYLWTLVAGSRLSFQR